MIYNSKLPLLFFITSSLPLTNTFFSLESRLTFLQLSMCNLYTSINFLFRLHCGNNCTAYVFIYNIHNTFCIHCNKGYVHCCTLFMHTIKQANPKSHITFDQFEPSNGWECWENGKKIEKSFSDYRSQKDFIVYYSIIHNSYTLIKKIHTLLMLKYF